MLHEHQLLAHVAAGEQRHLLAPAFGLVFVDVLIFVDVHDGPRRNGLPRIEKGGQRAGNEGSGEGYFREGTGQARATMMHFIEPHVVLPPLLLRRWPWRAPTLAAEAVRAVAGG